MPEHAIHHDFKTKQEHAPLIYQVDQQSKDYKTNAITYRLREMAIRRAQSSTLKRNTTFAKSHNHDQFGIQSSGLMPVSTLLERNNKNSAIMVFSPQSREVNTQIVANSQKLNRLNSQKTDFSIPEK